jgi:hypothetical protein
LVTGAEIVAARPITEIWVALGGDHPKCGRAGAFNRDGHNPQADPLNDAKASDHRESTGFSVDFTLRLVTAEAVS